ncbi:MAG: hypothetical protein NUV47_02900 [Patescibacteria group bacterium]|nr:hypothetical protein [Patescibacteria group bacterium]
MKIATDRTIERKKVVHDDQWVTATKVDVHFNNGKIIKNFLLVEMKGNGHVLVSARTKNGSFLFAHQCKPVSGMSIESVAGGCPDDIAHENQVVEEMVAEIGYKPKRLVRLNEYGFFPQTDRIDNRCHIFLAFDCELTSEVKEQDEKQGVGIIILTPEEVWQKIKSGEIKDTATVAGIFAHFLYESGKLIL